MIKEKIIIFKDLESLVGKLNFFGKAISESRSFIRRFYNGMISLKLSSYKNHKRCKRRYERMARVFGNFNGIVFSLRVSGVLQKLSNYLLIVQVQLTWAVVAIFRTMGLLPMAISLEKCPHSKRYYNL